MPQIGTFTRDTSGFAGRIATLSLFRDIVLEIAEVLGHRTHQMVRRYAHL